MWNGFSFQFLIFDNYLLYDHIIRFLIFLKIRKVYNRCKRDYPVFVILWRTYGGVYIITSTWLLKQVIFFNMTSSLRIHFYLVLHRVCVWVVKKTFKMSMPLFCDSSTILPDIRNVNIDFVLRLNARHCFLHICYSHYVRIKLQPTTTFVLSSFFFWTQIKDQYY